MKYIKLYENVINDLKVGDYVMINVDYLFGANKRELKIYKEFLKNNIGQVTYINNGFTNSGIEWFEVKFRDIPFQISKFFRDDNTERYKINNIIHHSDTIENLKIKIEADKYNL